MTFHVEKAGKSACGAEARGMYLVDRPLRSTCGECRRIAGVEPLPEHEVKFVVREPPSFDELLGRLIRLLCEARPDNRRELAEKALAALGV